MGFKDDLWVREVEGALKRYHRAEELAHHAIQHWPAVRARFTQHTTLVDAARQVLRHAIAELAKQRPDEARLLRERYLHGTSITSQAVERDYDQSTLHRRRTRALHEVASILAEHNRHAERQARIQRFTVRHQVVGAEPVVGQLVSRLRAADAPPVVVLEGMGGLGKTTIATLVARHFVTDDTFIRVLWASAQQAEWDHWRGRQRTLHPQPINAADIVRQLAQELAIDVHGDVQALQAEVVAHCKRRPCLVVIDNLETVADMAALASLVGALVGPSRVLITTRDRAPDALPAGLPRQYVPLHELDASTSCALLRSAAIHTGAVALAQAEDGELAQVYAVVGGNPLALWLVAGQAYNVPWQRFIDDLVAQCPRNSTSYELYNFLYRRSWEQLSHDAQLVLFAMHRCKGGASYAVLHALTDLDQHVFTNAVGELRQRMLLMFDGSRYTTHRLTYTFLRLVVAGWWQ